MFDDVTHHGNARFGSEDSNKLPCHERASKSFNDFCQAQAGIETRISQMEQTMTHQHNLLLHRLDHLSTCLFVRTPNANYPPPPQERPAWAPPVSSVSSPVSPPSLPADHQVPTSPLISGLPTQMTSTPPIKPWKLPSPTSLGLGAENTSCQHIQLQHSTTNWRLVARSPEIGLPQKGKIIPSVEAAKMEEEEEALVNSDAKVCQAPARRHLTRTLKFDCAQASEVQQLQLYYFIF